MNFTLCKQIKKIEKERKRVCKCCGRRFRSLLSLCFFKSIFNIKGGVSRILPKNKI